MNTLNYDTMPDMHPQTHSAPEKEREDTTMEPCLEPVLSVIEGKVDEIDDAVLHAQGHEAAMERQFNWISALGLAFSVTNSWVGYLASKP